MDQKTEGPHKFHKTCRNVFNQCGTSCQIPGHSVRPEADLLKESYTVFLIDLHLFSD